MSNKLIPTDQEAFLSTNAEQYYKNKTSLINEKFNQQLLVPSWTFNPAHINSNSYFSAYRFALLNMLYAIGITHKRHISFIQKDARPCFKDQINWTINHDRSLRIIQTESKCTKLQETVDQFNICNKLTELEPMLKDDFIDTISVISITALNQIPKFRTLLVFTDTVTWSLLMKMEMLWLNDNTAEDLDENQQESLACVKEIYKALITRDSQNLRKTQQHLEECKLWKEHARTQYKELLKCDITTRMNELERDRNRLEDEIQNYIKTAQQKRDMIEKISAEYQNLILNGNDEEIEDTIDFIINNKYMTLAPSTHTSEILIKIKAPITYYDESFLKTIIHKDRYNNTRIRKAFIKYVLQDKKYKLWCSSIIRFRMYNFTTIPSDAMYSSTYIPHPHVMRYGCQGNHPEQIIEWKKNNDFIGAFDQIIGMCNNLNLQDAIVFEKLLDDLEHKYPNKASFEDVKTGEFVSINDIERKYHAETQTD